MGKGLSAQGHRVEKCSFYCQVALKLKTIYLLVPLDLLLNIQRQLKLKYWSCGLGTKKCCLQLRSDLKLRRNDLHLWQVILQACMNEGYRVFDWGSKESVVHTISYLCKFQREFHGHICNYLTLVLDLKLSLQFWLLNLYLL